MGVESKLIGSPQFDQLEIIKVGFATVSSDGSPGNLTTVPHNLGFRPILLAYLNSVDITTIGTNVDTPLPMFYQLTIYAGEVHFTGWINGYVDDTNVKFSLFNGTLSAIDPIEIKYYLLRQKIS